MLENKFSLKDDNAQTFPVCFWLSDLQVLVSVVVITLPLMVFSLMLWHLGLADPGGRAPPKASKILGGSKQFAQERAFQMQRYHSRAHAPNHLLQHAVTLGATPCLPQSLQCQVSNS